LREEKAGGSSPRAPRPARPRLVCRTSLALLARGRGRTGSRPGALARRRCPPAAPAATWPIPGLEAALGTRIQSGVTPKRFWAGLPMHVAFDRRRASFLGACGDLPHFPGLLGNRRAMPEFPWKSCRGLFWAIQKSGDQSPPSARLLGPALDRGVLQRHAPARSGYRATCPGCGS
jgi:hypothetical protein